MFLLFDRVPLEPMVPLVLRVLLYVAFSLIICLQPADCSKQKL